VAQTRFARVSTSARANSCGRAPLSRGCAKSTAADRACCAARKLGSLEAWKLISDVPAPANAYASSASTAASAAQPLVVPGDEVRLDGAHRVQCDADHDHDRRATEPERNVEGLAD